MPLCGLDHGLGVDRVHSDACIQGSQPPQRQVGVEGAGGQAESIGQPTHVLRGLGVASDHGTPDHVGVPVDELGGGVQYIIRAEVDGTLQQRRAEGVVSHQSCAGGMGGLGDGFQVGDPQQRVRRGLREHHRGAVEGGREVLGVGEVHEPCLQAAPGGVMVQQPPGPAVAVVLADHHAADRDQLLDEQRHGRQARGHHGGCRASLKGRQGVRQEVAGGVAGAGVVVAAGFPGGREDVVRREMDGGHHRLVGGVRSESGAHRAGPGAEFCHGRLLCRGVRSGPKLPHPGRVLGPHLIGFVPVPPGWLSAGSRPGE